MCTFCLWPQTHSGHRWRLRSADDVANEVRYALEKFPGLKEIFFDDDTFNYRKERTIELCTEAEAAELHVVLHVARHHRLRHAEGDEGGRLPAADRRLRIGRSADPEEHQEGRDRRHGAALHRELPQAGPDDPRRFHRRPARRDARDAFARTIDFAKRLDTETIQVSIAHPYPGTEFYDYVKKNDLITIDSMTDEKGHQLPNIIYPGLDRGELVEWVERFYGEYYFRPKRRLARRAQGDVRCRRAQPPNKEAREYLALRIKRKKFVARAKGRARRPRLRQLRRLILAWPPKPRGSGCQDMDLRRHSGSQQRLRQFLHEARHARATRNASRVHRRAVPTIGDAWRCCS